MIALFKKGQRHDPKNYRGLIISSCIGKLFTNEWKISYLKMTSLLKTRLVSCLIINICDWYKSIKKGVYLCFIDMAKAFDPVNREFLFYKLYICNFSKKIINLIKSLYFENEACIRTKDGYTKAFPIYTGTRQGCNLSPYLFNIFMNDLPKYLEENNSNFVKLNNQIISCLMYADDIVLMNETKSGLQKSLSILETYCNKWQLNINIDKSKVLILNKRFSDFDDFKINNKSIECVKSYTYLGVEINTSCTFNSAIKRLCDKATRGYYSIYIKNLIFIIIPIRMYY